MPGRQFGQGENYPGVLVNGTTTVNGYSIPVDLTLTSRASGDAAEYVASGSVEFGGEFESGTTDEFTAYIADNTYAGTGNQVTGGGAYGTTGRYRYGFNGKEKDNEVKGVGNQQDYGMRIYDPRLGKFLSVDPLTKDYPWNSTYAFAENDVISNIDLDGLEKYNIHVRSFISAATTKDPLLREFKGDHRSTTTAEDVTARGRAQIQYDVQTKTANVVGIPYANQTERSNWGISTTNKTGKIFYRTNQFENGSKKVIDLLYSTYNPLTPRWFTPAVDVNSRFVIDYNKKSNTLKISYSTFADGYPSTESFIEDGAKNRILLGARKEEGTPASKLNGGPTELRFTGNISLNLDKDGNFVSVTVGSGKSMETYSIQDWNKKVREQFESDKSPKNDKPTH